MLCKHEANSKENNNAEVQLQQSHFATLLKSHPHTNMPPKICSTSAEHPPPGENPWRTASACKRISKDFNVEKFLFTVVKINLLTLKMNKQTNKWIKITSTQW